MLLSDQEVFSGKFEGDRCVESVSVVRGGNIGGFKL